MRETTRAGLTEPRFYTGQVTTRAQRLALWRLFLRDYDASYEPHRVIMRRYRAFRRRAWWGGCGFDRYLVINLWGMWIGIETDGYTHS